MHRRADSDCEITVPPLGVDSVDELGAGLHRPARPGEHNEVAVAFSSWLEDVALVASCSLVDQRVEPGRCRRHRGRLLTPHRRAALDVRQQHGDRARWETAHGAQRRATALRPIPTADKTDRRRPRPPATCVVSHALRRWLRPREPALRGWPGPPSTARYRARKSDIASRTTERARNGASGYPLYRTGPGQASLQGRPAGGRSRLGG
jgi:hypothetical protein